MSALLAQLGGNPFNTQVGQKIEQATDASLASENWTVNMEICDIINETDEGPKDAVKAIRKRLQQNVGKNYTVVMYSLTVLETCVKNCGKRFHLLVTQKDFVQDLVKLIGPKNDPPTAVQEKVLSLIQSWADTFRAIPEMQGVVLVYNDLKQKGIEFPMTDLDAMAPIYTPQRSVPTPKASKPQPTERIPPVQQQVQQSPEPVSSPLNLLPDQLAKLRSELDVVQGNMRVFGEMLNELTPGQEHPSDIELLQDLQKTCHSMQSRIVELIDKVANEEVTNELLRVNDELNNLFLRYERFEKKRSAVNQNGTAAVQHKQPQTQTDGKPLIDFGEAEGTSTNDIHVQLAGMSVGSSSASVALSQLNTVSATNKTPIPANTDEFDMFAQSRNVTYEQSKSSGSTYADNANPDQVGVTLSSLANARTQGIELQKEQDFAEMERWLEQKPEVDTQESITSSEFDRFLAERTAAAEKLPDKIPAERPSSAIEKSPVESTISGTTNRAASANQANRREMDREETENALFAL